MKSYFTGQRMLAQGKAWQIRILLSQWIKETGKNTAVKDFIEVRLAEPKLSTNPGLTRQVLG